MQLNVRSVRQCGAFSFIAKYAAEVEVTPGRLRVLVDVLSTVPGDADPALVAEATDAIRRGVESVLHARGSGAILRVHGLCINGADFAPRKLEQYTAEELTRALGMTP